MTTMLDDNMFDECMRGDRLYGDDFGISQITRWYEAEEEGYAGLLEEANREYRYAYHALNEWHGFSKLPKRRYAHALGLGSAFGHEFWPLIGSIDRITIIDPGSKFAAASIKGVPATYIKPQISGDILLPDGSVDLITCFGVLHHIPNVTHVVGQMARLLAKGGYVLIREPVTSMGDWRQTRKGLTRNERGIPLDIMDGILRQSGLQIRSRKPCMFSGLSAAMQTAGVSAPFNSKLIVGLDTVMSNLLAWNIRYDRRRLLDKLAPSCFFWVCTKSDA